MVTVALRTPFDLAAYPGLGDPCMHYGSHRPSLDALTSALFGDISFRGHLPVAIPGLYPGARDRDMTEPTAPPDSSTSRSTAGVTTSRPTHRASGRWDGIFPRQVSERSFPPSSPRRTSTSMPRSRSLGRATQGYEGADAVGLHIEGHGSPRSGRVHNPDHLRLPDMGVARRWAESRAVRMVTLAPELDHAFETAGIPPTGVVVSAGHSGADFETAAGALAGAWTAVTHLFNQMSPFHHRSPGLVGAAFLSDRPCGVIVDGIHADSSAVRLAWDHLGPDRFILITDAMQATGLGEGIYILGDREVSLGLEALGSAVPSSPAALTMDQAVANLLDWTAATEAQARASASIKPFTAPRAGDHLMGLLDEIRSSRCHCPDDERQRRAGPAGGRARFRMYPCRDCSTWHRTTPAGMPSTYGAPATGCRSASPHPRSSPSMTALPASRGHCGRDISKRRVARHRLGPRRRKTTRPAHRRHHQRARLPRRRGRRGHRSPCR